MWINKLHLSVCSIIPFDCEELLCYFWVNIIHRFDYKGERAGDGKNKH